MRLRPLASKGRRVSTLTIARETHLVASAELKLQWETVDVR